MLLVEQFVGKALGVASRAYVLEKGAVSFAGDAKGPAADTEFVRSSYLGSAETAARVGRAERPRGAGGGVAGAGGGERHRLPPSRADALAHRTGGARGRAGQ